jgi:DNA-binding XRE family transcriptional regulator
MTERDVESERGAPQILANAKTGEPEFAVIPIAEYNELLETAEMAEDVAALDAALAADEEMIPAEMVDRLHSGESRVRVWRQHRGMTQDQLAELSGLRQTSISEIETGGHIAKVHTLTKLAKALGVDLEDLVQPKGD